MSFDYIKHIDASLFMAINVNLQNRFFDYVMPWLSFCGNSGFIWILLALFLGVKNRSFGARGFILTSLALLGSFILADELLKHYFARTRPFQVMAGVNLLIQAPTDYSFPSGHAATAFAAATAIAMQAGRTAPAVLLLAALISFSRVYVGVHYPFDVLAGAVIGIATGWIAVKVASRFFNDGRTDYSSRNNRF
ncbi:phosphoesterase [Desulfocucumis palustris]|uniref:Phosphoesterase n=1 Tax=Desulfocucumis palustris TaxID=1898651 RepID=A0A2L2XGT4_9FIRM|nr:phosphatase PAP2 family protein [Desulfocucumis palustris]GBF35448.1 phosphoesterase [Desulfocucumis palustris]